MPRKRRPPTIINTLTVSIDLDGSSYRGSRAVYDDGWIDVTTADGSKRAELHRSSPESLARLLMHEIAREAAGRRRPSQKDAPKGGP